MISGNRRQFTTLRARWTLNISNYLFYQFIHLSIYFLWIRIILFSGSLRQFTTLRARWTLSISPLTSRLASWSLGAGLTMGFRWKYLIVGHFAGNISCWKYTYISLNISPCEIFHLVSCVLIVPSLWCTGVSLSPPQPSEIDLQNIFCIFVFCISFLIFRISCWSNHLCDARGCHYLYHQPQIDLQKLIL